MLETIKEFEASMRQVFNLALKVDVTDQTWGLIWKSLWDGDYFLERSDCEQRLERLIEIIHDINEMQYRKWMARTTLTIGNVLKSPQVVKALKKDAVATTMAITNLIFEETAGE